MGQNIFPKAPKELNFPKHSPKMHHVLYSRKKLSYERVPVWPVVKRSIGLAIMFDTLSNFFGIE